MKVVVSGAHGLIGSSLLPYLASKGHSIQALVRNEPANPSQIPWDPLFRAPSVDLLEGTDAVVHLAGESIAAGRWTESQKRKIRDSRVIGTRLLAETLVRMQRPPRVLVCASAIGFYGDRGPEALTESSTPGTGFLADVCRAWESAAALAEQKGIRVVHARFGIVLSPEGGALAKMLLPFRLGVGGIVGSGKQYMSWVALDDVIATIAYAMDVPTLHGPVNVVAPKPVTNAEFTKMLGRVLGRPTIFPLPAFAARLAFGEMADALLLSSARVEPAVLVRSGYHFQWSGLETALHHLLKK